MDAVYLNAYKRNIISHWFPSKDFKFDLHDFNVSCAVAALRLGFSQIFESYQDYMVKQLMRKDKEILQEPIHWRAVRNGVEILVWRGGSRSGENIPPNMIQTVEETGFLFLKLF